MKQTFVAGLIIVLLAIMTGVAPVSAQVSVTPEQMRMFQSLSPEQRAAILQQLGASAPMAPAAAQPPESTEAMDLSGFDLAIEEEAAEELRVLGDDTLVITATLKLDADPADAQAFMQDINSSRFLGTHLVKLDKRGILRLQGIASIPLAGLSADEVAIRLSSEPLWSLLDIAVTILPLTPTGTAALEPFGYQLFGDTDEADSFDSPPLFAMPVPRDYVLGPGDSLKVQLYGNENYETVLPVNRDGTINFPKIGPQMVAGLTFGELKDAIEKRIDEQLIGTEAAVSMGELRSIRVFVVGDVKRPGAYTMSSLARITNALFYAGGITEIGSLRQIQMKRAGKLIKTLDLYELLLNGNSRNDAQLRSDDVVLIPPAKKMVGIDGEIKRPAIYELRSENTVAQLIDLAGGKLPTADSTMVQLMRVNERGSRTIETLNLLEQEGRQMTLQSGDFVTLLPVLDELEDAVFLSGHTTRPGDYEWTPGMTLVDLIPSDNYLLPKADLGYVMVRRESGADRQAMVLSTDLRAARSNPREANLILQSRDRVTIFQLGIARSAAMQGILEELEAQATREQPFQMVNISGQVRAPGSYPLEATMRISDLLRAGGGLSAAAYSTDAELRRYVIDEVGARRTELIPVDLAAVTAGDPLANLELQPYDYLNVKEVPAWEEQFEVRILGEVRFPGTYPMRRGETMGSVLQRAGGLTDLAFPAGSIFTRETLQDREREQIGILTARLEADLAGMALRAAADPSGSSEQAMSVGQNLLAQLQSTEPTGRLVIDLERIISSDSGDEFDIELRDGDILMVPHRSQEVMVLGEVQYATSHLFNSGQARDDYIELSGGLTANADPKRIYVVRANGAVEARKGSRWFRGRGSSMRPGDTIVVPMDTDRMPRLAQWASITQIIYNMAIAVAAVNSF
ncbi:MAG: SLBB domain-containing protein [Gammaproteobacteria bacterium]|nr:SLBB domain-containing protein [Gammaproteobacteria bacterium]